MSDQSLDELGLPEKDLLGVPVVTIDGPSGTGKGTIARKLAVHLSYHMLDSGALYRLLALCTENHNVDIKNDEAITVLAEHLDVQFKGLAGGETQVILEGEDVSSQIRTEEIGHLASKVAVIPSVREALLSRQHAFRESPGLVADGRDMGTVVFVDALTKIFLSASPEERASRRYKQLKGMGQSASLADLEASIRARDERDRTRSVSPLVPAHGALEIDTSNMSIEEVFQQVLDKHEADIKRLLDN